MKTCALALFCLLIAACDNHRGSNPGATAPHGQHVGHTLVAIGTLLTWAGGAALAAGLLAGAASFFPWTSFLAIFRSLFVELAVLGLGAVLVGTSFLWVGDHPWMLGVAVGLVVVVLGVRYRRRLAKLLGLSAAKVKT